MMSPIPSSPVNFWVHPTDALIPPTVHPDPVVTVNVIVRVGVTVVVGNVAVPIRFGHDNVTPVDV